MCTKALGSKNPTLVALKEQAFVKIPSRVILHPFGPEKNKKSTLLWTNMVGQGSKGQLVREELAPCVIFVWR